MGGYYLISAAIRGSLDPKSVELFVDLEEPDGFAPVSYWRHYRLTGQKRLASLTEVSNDWRMEVQYDIGCPTNGEEIGTETFWTYMAVTALPDGRLLVGNDSRADLVLQPVGDGEWGAVSEGRLFHSRTVYHVTVHPPELNLLIEYIRRDDGRSDHLPKRPLLQKPGRPPLHLLGSFRSANQTPPQLRRGFYVSKTIFLLSPLQGHSGPARRSEAKARVWGLRLPPHRRPELLGQGPGDGGNLPVNLLGRQGTVVADELQVDGQALVAGFHAPAAIDVEQLDRPNQGTGRPDDQFQIAVVDGFSDHEGQVASNRREGRRQTIFQADLGGRARMPVKSISKAMTK